MGTFCSCCASVSALATAKAEASAAREAQDEQGSHRTRTWVLSVIFCFSVCIGATGHRQERTAGFQKVQSSCKRAARKVVKSRDKLRNTSAHPPTQCMYAHHYIIAIVSCEMLQSR